MTPLVTDVRLSSARPEQVRKGLLCFVSLRYGDLLVDGVTLRVTEDGRHALSFPVRRDRKGRDHAVVRPVDQDAREAIEAAVFAALRLERTR